TGEFGASTTLVKDLILLESTRDYKWYGKTGSCPVSDSEWVLWHVGFIEHGGVTTFYALNLSDTTYAKAAARRAVLIRKKLGGLIPSEPPARTVQMSARVQELIDGFPGT